MKKLASRRLSAPFVFRLLLRGAAAASDHPGSSRSLRPRRRVRASRAKFTVRGFAVAAGVLLAAGSAAAQTLLVDQADGNSPYAVTADQTYTDVHVGDNGIGVLNQSANTFTVNGSSSGQALFVGYNVNSNGSYNLSGSGNLVDSHEADIGTSGLGVFNQTGGTATFYGNGLYVGAHNGSTGAYIQNGGTVNANTVTIANDGSSNGAYTLGAGSLYTGSINVGLNGFGTFTQNGGTWTTNGNIVLVGFNGGSLGTLTLKGGTLTTSGIVGSQSGGNSNLVLNGGTLVASAGSPSFLTGLTSARLQGGGVLINTNGFNATVPQVLAHDPTLGTAADGGVTKLGAGLLTLAAANTFTGPSTVSAGTLAVSANGGLGKGSVTVAGGGTLTLAAGVTAAHNASTNTTLTLAATSTINLNATNASTIQDTYGALVVAGVAQTLPGTYGSATSGAEHVLPEFTGNGEILLNAVPEPGTWAWLVAGIGLLCAGVRYHRSHRGAQT